MENEKGVEWRVSAGVNGVRFERPDPARWRGFPWITGTWDAGTPLPIRNASLWLRTALGGSPGDPAQPFANFFFGGFGNNWVDWQDPKRYRQIESFPGIEINEVGGTDFAKATLETQLPPLRFSRLGHPAFYIPWVRLSVFGSGLVTDLERDADRRRLANAGAQADLRLQLLMQQPLTFSVGYARAFERQLRSREEWMVSLKIL